jgi:hypothetical protein
MTHNVYATVNSEGDIQQWHMTSGKCLSLIETPKTLDPQLYCLDYNQDASNFAVCGSEPCVSLFDFINHRFEFMTMRLKSWCATCPARKRKPLATTPESTPANSRKTTPMFS